MNVLSYNSSYDKEYFGMSSHDMMGPGMNIETGVFTAGYGGVYLISWSITASDTTDTADMEVYLYKNSMQIPETALSLHISGYNVYETSSRSIISH